MQVVLGWVRPPLTPQDPLPPKTREVTLCTSLPQVNLPSSGDFYSITKQQADVKFWSELMCIVSDNNPNLGENYPGEQASHDGSLQRTSSVTTPWP